ncbi:MAG: S8 family serine peptidase [Calditrichaeota bacterium]|nr:S8 family serine peptidase [Calditrichota bacterium]
MTRQSSKLLLVGWLLILGASSFGQGNADANLFNIERSQETYVPGEVLVKFKSQLGIRSVEGLLSDKGVKAQKSYESIGVVKYTMDGPSARSVDGDKMAELLDELRSDPNVEYAEPNYYVYALETTPNDSRFGEQWALKNTGQSGGTNDADIDGTDAWDTQRGSQSVIVGVIDTGIDYNHPDLQANIWKNPGESGNGKETNGVDDDGNGFVDDWRGWDFANNDNDPFDDNAHGTHCAGIIGAVGNNNRGVSGINWNVSLVGLKFLTGSGSGSTSDAIDAILYAVQMNIPILSNSWGGGGFSQALADAVEAANQAGILFVAAAGNENNNNDSNPNYPSNYTSENVLAVASSDRRDIRSSFSNYGKTTVDLAAPGSDILSTTPNNNYQSFSGTSMATPYAAGTAALVKAQYPNINHIALKYRLMGSVDFVSDFVDRTVTEGRVNAAKALSGNPLITTEQHEDTNDNQTPYTITAFIVDDGSITNATLNYSLSGSGSGTGAVPMTANGVSYTANIPPQAIGTTIEYSVKATDNANNSTTGRMLAFDVTGTPPPGNGGGGLCGASAMTLNSGHLGLDLFATVFFNLMIFIGLPYFLFKRRK